MTTNTPPISYQTFDEPPTAALLVVDAGLDAHNHAAASLDDVRPLAAIASLPSGEVIGGAVGRTWGGCCELLQLWVHPGHRGRQRLTVRVEHPRAFRSAGLLARRNGAPSTAVNPTG